VVIRGRVEVPRHRVELEFVPSSIELLSELRDKKSKKLILKLSNRQVNEELIQSLNALFSENNGYCKIEFHVTDHNESLHVVLPSRNKSVQPNNDLIRKLAKMGIEYKLS
jgi:DNA polymerase-3 subunit alpha